MKLQTRRLCSFMVKSSPVHIIMIGILSILIYSNTFNVPFVYEDVRNISDNPLIKDSSLLLNSIKSFGLLLSNRITGLVSFNLNYRIHKLNVPGYHAVNIGIHMINSILIYYLIVLIYKSPFLRSYIPKTNIFLPQIHAFLAAAIFAVHPVQTEAVTYIVQRYNLLVALFMLCSLITYIKMISSDSRAKKIAYCIMSVLSLFLAAKSKEVAFLLPFLVIIIHLSFYRGTLSKIIINSFIFFVLIALIPITIFRNYVGILGELGILTSVTPDDAMRLNTTSPIYYFFTQLSVLVTYIRLLLIPVNQTIVYDYPFYTSFFNVHVFSSFIFLLSIILLAVYASFSSDNKDRPLMRLAAAGIFWYFLFLLPHTLIPSNDLVIEHRLYFPSIGFIIFITTSAIIIAEKTSWKFALSALLAIIVIFSVLTFKRNMIWQSEILLWKDVVKKSPDSMRGHFILGLSYLNHGDYDYSIDEFQKTSVLYSKYSQTKLFLEKIEQVYLYMGISFFKKADYDKAADMFKRSIALSRNNDEFLINAYNGLGNTYLSMNNYDNAFEQYYNALKLDNGNVQTHINLGNYYIKVNNIDQAITEFEFIAGNNPADLQAHFILGLLFTEQTLYDEAIAEFKKNIDLNISHGESYIKIASIYFIMKKYNSAEDYLLKAISIDPSNSEALQLMRQVKSAKIKDEGG